MATIDEKKAQRSKDKKELEAKKAHYSEVEKILRQHYKDMETNEESYQKFLIAKANAEKEHKRKTLKSMLQDRQEAYEEAAASAEDYGDKLALSAKASMTKMASAIGENLKQAFNTVDKGVSEYAKTYSQYFSYIDTRLAGTDMKFADMVDNIATIVGLSPYISQKQMLENLYKMVQSGIAYNVENRAFIATVSDKIATTFDAFDASLLTIIRLQQGDSTIARLGMETALTSFLGGRFSDTSYLNQGYNTVEATLLGTISQMQKQEGVELEYVVQSWLGALGSVGLSQSGISALATALNQLGTGDISGLGTPIQNLLALASTRSGGVDYVELLQQQGLDSKQTNDLLKSIVEFVQEIASTQNQVVKSQYAAAFGISVQDLTAFSNLSASDISAIYGNIMSYDQTQAYAQGMYETIGQRTHLSQWISTLTENVETSVVQSIVNSPAAYAIWTVADMLEKAVAGIPITTISVMGNMIELNTSVAELLKGGLMGFGVISTAINALNMLTGESPISSLSAFGYQESMTRGTGTMMISSGATRTQSSSAYIGSTDEGAQEGIVSAAKESAQQQYGESSEGKTEIERAIEESIQPDVATIREVITMIQTTLTQLIDGTSSVHTNVDNFSEFSLPQFNSTLGGI